MYLHQKWKVEQRNSRAAGSFNPPSYTADDGQLDQNMCYTIKIRRHVNMNIWTKLHKDGKKWEHKVSDK
jgi:hypothetical protein